MEEYIEYHNDGTIWSKGQKKGNRAEGYWEWYRKDGTKLRSGHFTNGKPSGEWTTYDQKGNVYQVTILDEK